MRSCLLQTSTREDRGSNVSIDRPGPPAMTRFGCRPRMGDAPESDIARSCDWFGHGGRDTLTCRLRSGSTPTDDEFRLRPHGSHKDETESELTAMQRDAESSRVDGRPGTPR
jgi:hypothetical protein